MAKLHRQASSSREVKAAEAVPDVTLPELFERQVAQFPDAIAVVCGQARWSYAEVEGRANRLARFLVSRGAVTGHVVGPGDAGSVVGTAIPDLRMFVLDERLGLVPPGAAGEMYVAGAGLGRTPRTTCHTRGACTGTWTPRR
jgi:non-ribosomal peptide synthetase component F